jgi:hypothetical protein
MKLQADGDFGEWITVGGNHFYPGYIIKGRQKRLMIDAGINMMGPAYIASLEKTSGIKTLWTMFSLPIPILTISARFPISKENCLVFRSEPPGALAR